MENSTGDFFSLNFYNYCDAIFLALSSIEKFKDFSFERPHGLLPPFYLVSLIIFSIIEKVNCLLRKEKYYGCLF